ncbi:MAG TPA: class IV adenylate cyclase [Candidatus Angelobacter sp.]
MAGIQEIEIKFQIEDGQAFASRLPAAGFHLVTARTHELNTLYDLRGAPLRSRGALLRLRQYGTIWTLTYKDKSLVADGHKSRREIETRIADGAAMAGILGALGFKPSFAYEKFRSEWADETGHVVIDETPIGNFGEIEGPPAWIDTTAGKLEIGKEQYITASYAELFAQWRVRTRSAAANMTFHEVGATG